MFVPIRSLHHRSLVSCSWLHAPRLSLSSCSSLLFKLHVCYHRIILIQSGRFHIIGEFYIHVYTVRTILDPGTIKPVTLCYLILHQNFRLYGFWLVLIHSMFSTNCYYRHWVYPYFLTTGPWVHPYFLTNGHWVHPYFLSNGHWVHPYFLTNGHWVHPYFLTNGHWVHPYFLTTGHWVHPYFLTTGHWVHPYFLTTGDWVHPYFLSNGHWIHPYFLTTGH